MNDTIEQLEAERYELFEGPAYRFNFNRRQFLQAFSGGIALIVAALVGIFASGFGALEIAALAVGIVLVATHWGWVHVAEYVGLTIDEHQQRANDDRARDWLATIQPYPRFSISTSVLNDASTCI